MNSFRIQSGSIADFFLIPSGIRILSESNKNGCDQLKTSPIRIDNTSTRYLELKILQVVDPVWKARRSRRHGSILHWWHHPPPRNPTAITIQDYLIIKSKFMIGGTQRDGEYNQRSYLRGFCHNPHRGVDERQHSCKTTKYKCTDSPLPPLLNVMYCVRVSLRTAKIFLAWVGHGP